MLHEFDAAFGYGGVVFLGPDFVLGDFENGAAVLKDEAEGGIEMGQLDEESTFFPREVWPSVRGE